MKKYVTFTLITIAILISIISIAILLFKSETPTTPAVAVSDVDIATQTVISEKLIVENCIRFTNGSLKLNGYYFDGNRLYISIHLSDNEILSDLNPNSFCLKSKDDEKNADIVYNSKDIECVIGEKTNNCIVVFNHFNYKSDIKYCMSYNELITENFYIKENSAKHHEIGTSSEEVTLNFADFGTTSTLLNCDINAFIEGFSFQFQTKDAVCTVYLTKKDGDNYSFLIPMKLNEVSEGYLIVNGRDENVELRAFVSLATKNPNAVI